MAAGSEYILQPEQGASEVSSLPSPCSLLPGIVVLSLPIATARALVWPPSSSPDSVHSLLPVSLPPRHSLPHVARGMFLKRTSGYFPPRHKSFRDALWPAGQSPVSAGMACEALHHLALPAHCAPPARPHTCPGLQPHSAPCSLRRAPYLWTCCSFCLEFPCPPGELLVLQDSAQTAPPRRLPRPAPPTSPSPGPPDLCTSMTLGLPPTHGAMWALPVGLLPPSD